MPYDPKSREKDVGVAGTVRLPKRERQDRSAEIQVPRATGGAPKRDLAGQVGEMEQSRQVEESPNLQVPNQGASAPTRLSDEEQIRYQRPVDLQPVTDYLGSMPKSIDQEFRQDNQELIEIGSQFMGELRSQGFDPDPEGVFSSDAEMAQYALAFIRRNLIELPRAQNVLGEINQSREGRQVALMLSRWQERNTGGR